MRKKINFQATEYSSNGELICFGLSEHILEEEMPHLTEKAARDITVLRSWFKRDKPDEIITRPAYRSDWNWTSYASRAQVRVLLGLLVIRELPIKKFYIRCWLAYFYIIYFVIRGLGRGLKRSRPIVLYNQAIHAKSLANYPDLLYWNLTRIMPQNPPIPDANREWKMRQNPVFHQYHKTTYRYRNRKPRYVPWDGTMSQPVMPYMIDIGSEVINGTFKRNCNTVPQLK